MAGTRARCITQESLQVLSIARAHEIAITTCAAFGIGLQPRGACVAPFFSKELNNETRRRRAPWATKSTPTPTGVILQDFLATVFNRWASSAPSRKGPRLASHSPS